MSRTLTPILLTGLLVACGGGGAESDFISACEGSSDLTSENCECLAAQAAKELPDHGLEFMTAMIEEDKDKLGRLRATLPTGEFMKMGLFMMTAPVQCAINMDLWNSDK